VSHGRHESTDVRLRPIVVAGVTGVVVLGVVSVAMWGLLGVLRQRAARDSPPANPLARYARTEPPAPRLQTDPRGDLQRLRAAEEAELGGYGWVDAQAGIVHIPIERAMDLYVARAGKKGRTP
jgi:hypothetical protein